MNLSECIDINARKFAGSKPAMICDDTGEQWTYPMLNQQINTIANALEDLGVSAGSRVALMLRSRPELILCSYAIYRAGGVYVVINSRLKEKETRHILTNSGAEILVCDSSVQALIDEIRDQCAGLKHVIVYGKTEREHDSFIPFSKFIAGKSDKHPVKPDIHDIAAIFYTGGTTGTPKGVVLSHEAIIGNSLAGSKRLLFDENSVVVSANPMFHIGGMAGGPYYAFLNGGTLVQQEFFDAEKYVAAAVKYKADHIWGVPTFFYSINQLSGTKIPSDIFKNIKIAFSAAGVFYTPIRKAFEKRFGIKVYQYYGLTENSPGITVEDPLSTDERRYEAVGTPLPGVEIKIVDEKDNELPAGEEGELCVRSPYLMKEYWQNPGAMQIAMQGGWLHTGDHGWIDEKNYFYIMGRKHDMILVGGTNVYPAEVEKLIMEDEPRLRDVAVVGVYDERLGEVPKAFVVLQQGARMTEGEIISLARSKMAHYKAPRSVSFVDGLPMTTVGKVDKKALQERK